MKVFAVFKEGIYRHECGGVFSTLAAATDAAKRLIAGEYDNHHDYTVVPFDLDVMTEQTPVESRVGWKGHTFFSGGDLREADALVRISRRKPEVTPTDDEYLCWPGKDEGKPKPPIIWIDD